ncbi:MAG: hypothetical protein LBD64_01360 [Odoribacteraceae bacterium]|jgi:hypothetical protein|nr:hypothetical protein [Odoribacteraceae bacterium]
MRKIIQAAILAFAIATVACHEDQGNYDYISLEEIEIDTAGMEILSAYSIYRYDTLRLAPVVYLDGKRVETDPLLEQKIDYHWSIYKATTAAGVTSVVDTIGKNAMLDAIITQPAGTWIILFTVTLKDTGIKAFMKFSLQIDEIVSDGWMVLYEREGDTDVGLIVNDRVKKGVIQERLLLDIYSASNEGQRLPGKPVSIIHSIAPLSSGEVLVASERDLVAVEKTSFGRYYDMERLFWMPPATRALSYVGGNYTRREVVINNNRIHYVNYMSSGLFRVDAFGSACLGEYGQLAPWLSSFYSASFEAIAYDQTNKRFLCVTAAGVSVDTLNSKDKTAFDVNNVGMEMVLSDYGRSNYEFTLARNGSEYALLVSNFYTTNINSDKIAIAKYDMSDCPGIAAVSSIAPGGLGEFIYYASGQNLHVFKYNVTGSDRVQVAWSAPAGETITCARLQRSYYPTFALAGFLINNYAVIYIATWNETIQSGSVYQMVVDPSNAVIDNTSRREYTGFGKVKEMSWKWTL